MGKHKFLNGRYFVFIGVLISVAGFAFSSPFHYLEEFCAIGERTPGSPAHRQAMRYIVDHLPHAEVDSFDHRGVRYFNIRQKFSGTGPAIGLGVHWDSYRGCPGANDGGSGVALLLALADTLRQIACQLPVHLLFFDGEDVNQAECIGSNHFARACIEQYSFILILDMVGDRDLKIYKEGNSNQFFPDLVDSIWKIGNEVSPGYFLPEVKYYISDDHIPLIRYGFRAIDIIDFDYSPYWHTAEDKIDKCSAASLEAVYRMLLKLIYEAEKK